MCRGRGRPDTSPSVGLRTGPDLGTAIDLLADGLMNARVTHANQLRNVTRGESFVVKSPGHRYGQFSCLPVGLTRLQPGLPDCCDIVAALGTRWMSIVDRLPGHSRSRRSARTRRRLSRHGARAPSYTRSANATEEVEHFGLCVGTRCRLDRWAHHAVHTQHTFAQ
jgi:hypothetical protein